MQFGGFWEGRPKTSGAFWNFLELLGASWKHLGALWQRLGSALGCLGASCKHQRVSWELLGRPGGAFGPQGRRAWWEHQFTNNSLNTLACIINSLKIHPGGTWGRLYSSWGTYWSVLVHLRCVLGRLGGSCWHLLGVLGGQISSSRKYRMH